MDITVEKTFTLTVSHDELRVLLAALTLINDGRVDHVELVRVTGDRGISITRGVQLTRSLTNVLTQVI
jgi:hypothetical protein